MAQIFPFPKLNTQMLLNLLHDLEDVADDLERLGRTSHAINVADYRFAFLKLMRCAAWLKYALKVSQQE